MAYNKKTWLARLGQGLNKFSIDGATPVPIINQPDSVTQQGDALSAGNLNDLEQRIADAFDDVEESKADKSTTDALQSQINQQEARLNQHESRLENLEQKAGDYTTVQYRGTNAVPTGKAKNGLVEKIVGKTRAWNQHWNLSNATVYDSSKLNTPTISGNSISATVKASGTGSYQYGFYDSTPFEFIAGHKILFAFSVYSNASVAKFGFDGGNWVYPAPNVDYTSGTTLVSGMIVTVSTSVHEGLLPRFSTGSYAVGDTVRINWLNVIDLTLYFGGTLPADAETVADLQANYPELFIPSPYDAGSLVSTEVSGVKSVWMNIFDEETEIGKINDDGTEGSANNRLRSKNYIPLKSNTEYYIKCPNYGTMWWYDANKNCLGYANGSWTNGGGVITSAVGACYGRFSLADAYGTTYNNDIQICSNSLPDAIKTVYHPYKTDTLSLSETVTLRSAGAVADELDVESGVIKRKVGVVDLGNVGFSYSVSRSYFYSNDLDSLTNRVADANDKGNLTCSEYGIDTAYNLVYGSTNLIVAVNNSDSNKLLIKNTGKTGSDLDAQGKASWLSGVYLNYELATPTTDSIDPILDNFLEVEGGGTVETIQTQTPVIDNCLDVGYLTL